MERNSIKNILIELAERYETADFINGDPSWFMHQVDGDENKELLAFVASTLSYGSRKQFLPKIQYFLDCSKTSASFYEWIKNREFENAVPYDNGKCFYRLYTYATMHSMLTALSEMLNEYGSMRGYMQYYVQYYAIGRKLSGIEAVDLIVNYFSSHDIEGIIPKNTKSSCKRICMFLRWMVRSNSPVDIGLWSDIIDCSTLIIPMDTHVLQEANRLGLMNSKSASMASAMKLTERLREFFPDDPLKGDFALFGVGVSGDNE